MAEEPETKEQVEEAPEPEPQEAAGEAENPEGFFDTDIDKIDVPASGPGAVAEVGTRTLELLYDLELPLSVELARKEMQIREILNLGEGSIVEFDKLAGEPVDILVNDKKIAEGEVVVIEDRFGVRITGLVDPSERIRGLSELG